jgi:hypothetical protein
MSPLRLLLIGLLIGIPLSSEAARTASVDQPLTVKLEVRYPVSITYPENIHGVFAPGRMEGGAEGQPGVQSITVENYGPIVVIGLLHPEAAGRIIAIGESGKAYHINYKPGTPADDDIALVRAPKAMEKSQPMTYLGFMRMAYMGEVLPGEQVADLPLPAVPDSRLRLIKSRVTAIGPAVHMVLLVENTGTQPVMLDVRIGEPVEGDIQVVALSQWVWPPGYTIRAVTAEHERLEPGGQTRIIVVFERRIP